MTLYLLVLVASVFLGTELFSLSLPGFQLTVYRLLGLGAMPLMILQIWRQNRQLTLGTRDGASSMVVAYGIWWFSALLSFFWVKDLVGWAQAVFLLTLGMSASGLLYWCVSRLDQWKKLVRTAWIMMSGLIVWGYFEILTNIYLFADLSKLDRRGTFNSDMGSRIPVTIFENQNDFATMLLAYLCLNLICQKISKSGRPQFIYWVTGLLATYLIYRTDSRMSLLCVGIFFGTYWLTQLRYDLSTRFAKRVVILLLLALVAIFATVPQVSDALGSVIYTGQSGYLSGDLVRVNLLRLGIIFLGQTFGLGVGAGNIEYWMEHAAFLPLKGITNMHHWWFEILVGYGLIPFIVYVVAYGHLVQRLWQIQRISHKFHQPVVRSLLAFLVTFVFASTTSANNILIEWHWVFFGLILAYLKVVDTSNDGPYLKKERSR